MKLSSLHARRATLLAILFVATGCSQKVADVGANLVESAPVQRGSVPPSFPEAGVDSGMHMIVRDGQMLAFAASVGRLFWVSAHGSAGTKNSPPDFPGQVFLRSCLPFSCAQSLQSVQLAPTDADFLVPSWVFATVSRVFWPDDTGLSFCNHDDCSSIGHLPFTATFFVADEKQSFFDGTAACDIDDCSSTYRHLAPSLPSGEPSLRGANTTVLDEDYLYQIDAQRIVRFKKDGTGEIQIIARDQVDAFHITVGNGYVYWTESVSLGRLLRCPVEGCRGDPEVVASRLDHPADLTVDADYVYFVEPAPTNRISKCAIAGCDTPDTLVENQGVGTPFVDGQFVYFRGADCSSGCTSYIGVVSK